MVKPPPASLPDGTLVIDIAVAGDERYLPFERGVDAQKLVTQAIYAELVRMDPTGAYFPYLAAELPTLGNGGLRFTGQGAAEQFEVEFRLRPGLTWHDGQPLNSADLVFSWNLVMDPAWPGRRYGRDDWAPEVYVAEVVAPAPDRVVYRFMSQAMVQAAAQTGGRLSDPAPYAHLAQQVGPVVPVAFLDVGRNVFPRHRLEGVPVASLADHPFFQRPVYAGAYRLVSGGQAPGRPIVLEAFEGFALGRPAIARLQFGALPATGGAEHAPWLPPARLSAALQAGTVHAQLGRYLLNLRDGDDRVGDFHALAESGVAKVHWLSANLWEILDFNLDNPHLADLRVRQATAHAINREAIIADVLDGAGQTRDSYLPTWHPLYAQGARLPQYPYSPERARALLAQAGYDLSTFPVTHPERGPLTLELASFSIVHISRPQIAEHIRADLAAVGVAVNVTFYEPRQFEARDCSGIRNSRSFDLGLAGWFGAGPRPVDWVEMFSASWRIPTPENNCTLENANWPGWRSARADALLPQLRDGRLALEHPELYRARWADHQVLWAADLPSLPLFDAQRPVPVSPLLIGFEPSPYAFSHVNDTWNVFTWRFGQP